MSPSLGKLPRQMLERVVLKQLGFKRDDVLLGPRFGEDAALLKVNGKILAASSDPLTGAARRVGWLAVHANANDIATRGIRPRWFLSNILLPRNASETAIRAICGEVHRACKQLHIAIVGGHCEYMETLAHPIVVGCMLGTAEGRRIVSCGNAKVDDELILTKAAGIEGTAILASTFRRLLRRKFGSTFVTVATRYDRWVSVVEDALAAFNAAEVHAMHDPTEGGLAGGVHELAEAAGVGFIVEEKKVPVHRETLSPRGSRILEY
ncbi:MAG: AIR synthase family protein, partial [Candidatus Bathyarchaeia archaeon]